MPRILNLSAHANTQSLYSSNLSPLSPLSLSPPLSLPPSFSLPLPPPPQKKPNQNQNPPLSSRLKNPKLKPSQTSFSQKKKTHKIPLRILKTSRTRTFLSQNSESQTSNPVFHFPFSIFHFPFSSFSVFTHSFTHSSIHPSLISTPTINGV